MTEVFIAVGSAFLGWAGTVEYRLGQLMKMSKDVEKTADRVDKIYDLMVEQDARTAEEGPGERRR